MGVPDFLGYKIYIVTLCQCSLEFDVSVLGCHIALRQSLFAHKAQSLVMHQTSIGCFSFHFYTSISVLRFPHFSVTLPKFPHPHTCTKYNSCIKNPTPTCRKYNSRIKNPTPTCRKQNSGTKILHLHVDSITHTSAYNIAKKDRLIYSLKAMYSMVLSLQSSGSFLVVGQSDVLTHYADLCTLISVAPSSPLSCCSPWLC